MSNRALRSVPVNPVMFFGDMHGDCIRGRGCSLIKFGDKIYWDANGFYIAARN